MADKITKLLIRRGLDESRKSIKLAEGELGYTTDKKRLYIGDGDSETGTLGGIPVDYDVKGSDAIVVETNNYQHTISIKKLAITTEKIADNAVKEDKIADNAVTKRKLDTTISNQIDDNSNLIDNNIKSIAGLRTDVNAVSGKADANAAAIEAVTADVKYVSGQVDANVEDICRNIDDIYVNLNTIKSYVVSSFYIPSTSAIVNGITDVLGGASWGRVWSDGWLEQGGFAIGGSQVVHITFPVPFNDTNYNIIVTPETPGNSNNFNPGVLDGIKTDSGVMWNTMIGSRAPYAKVHWYACGYNKK